MDKKLISHSIAIITTPFYFSFLLAVAYAIYFKEYSNIFAGTPIIIFMTMFLYMISAPCILLVDYYAKNIKLPPYIKVMLVIGVMTCILTLIFFRRDGIDYMVIILGTISGYVYFLNEYIVTKYILTKLKFLKEHS